MSPSVLLALVGTHPGCDRLEETVMAWLHYIGCRLFGWHGIWIVGGVAWCEWCPWSETLPEAPE